MGKMAVERMQPMRLFNEESWPQIVKLKNDLTEIINGQEPAVCLSALLWTVSEILNDITKDQNDFERSTANCVRALQESAVELFIYKQQVQSTKREEDWRKRGR
jgi:hypothetical protein